MVVMCREKVKKYPLYSGFYLHHIVFHALSPLSPLIFARGLPLFSMLRVHVWRKKKGWGGYRPDGQPGARGDEISPQEVGILWSFQMSLCGAKEQNRLPKASP